LARHCRPLLALLRKALANSWQQLQAFKLQAAHQQVQQARQPRKWAQALVAKLPQHWQAAYFLPRPRSSKP
jgi:hypothetical protein